jgi:hypothetical protein
MYAGDELYGDEVTSGPAEDAATCPDCWAPLSADGPCTCAAGHDDGWQEFKDGRAVGRIEEDGQPCDMEPPDWSYQGLTYPDGSPQEQYHADDALPGEAPF